MQEFNPINKDKFLDITKATEQEVFDFACEHLLTQKERSESETNCRYKGDEGLMCAAAPFIPNYKYNMEGVPWEDLVFGWEVPDNYISLIASLQVIHDKKIPQAWQEELESLASDYNLDFNYKNLGSNAENWV